MQLIARLKEVLTILSSANELALTQLNTRRKGSMWYANIWSDNRRYHAYGKTRLEAVYRLCRNTLSIIEERQEKELRVH